MLNAIMLKVGYAECHVFIVILKAVMLSIIMQSVIMLSVIIPVAVASLSHMKQKKMLSFILGEVGFVASGSYIKPFLHQ
jgi:hypothetical protein